ncbi:MAG TPA: 1-acyl-sn-glycerol-3-phosphate acyltransferase [Opitutaceae bacterium]
MFSSIPGSLARRVVRALVEFYYPRIEVTGGERIPAAGPVLLAANHPNSLIDPVLLGIAARRPVRLMAKAPLFNIPVFGAAMRALGMVPAYRGSDDAKQVTKNLESLALAARQLAAGHVMGIFPEGKSHDAAQLALVRSGAARLAMQALAADTPGLQVVPVGMNYERKERFRTAVWINVGEPVDAAAWLAQHGGDEHVAMRTLTAELNTRLRACVVHLDDATWEPLLDDVEALLPAAGFRQRDALAALHQRKAVADAINHFHRSDRPRAEAAAARVRAHGAALRTAGLAGDARLLQVRGPRLTMLMARDGLALLCGAIIGLFGALHHAVPYGLVRLIAGFIPTPGRMTVALNRLLLSVPLYAAWYAAVWWWQSGYFLPWVAWTWAALMPFAGLVALNTGRRLRTELPLWWAQVRLLLRPRKAAALRTAQHDLVRELTGFADELSPAPAVSEGPVPRSVTYRPPLWLNLTLGGASLMLAGLLGAWLLRDRPIEFLLTRSPALHQMAAAELAGEMAGDERALVAVIGGLDELEKRFRAFEAELLAGRRSYYRTADDDEMRRMLVTWLSYRTALLRTVWKYQRHAQLTGESARLRALLLHYTAAAAAYDTSARFVLAFEGQTHAIRKLNEPEPRWDLPAGTYDRIRANLAHVAHRRWLEAAWKHYHETLPRWSALGMGPASSAAELPDATSYPVFHHAIAVAGENTARLSERLLRYKLETAVVDVANFARGGYYHASSAISTLVGDTKIREPRHGRALITAERLAELRPRLQPGDILIERRNWYLSNAFLPGYWPHSALYVGTAEDLRALGLDRDPRAARHLARFAQPDAAGHAPAVIEAVSEGVVFTSVEHSVGEADSVAVLRPRISTEQRRELIARAFEHAGKPYDFDFDFFSSDKLVCTEVVYRACNGTIDFPLVEILGRKTLPALEIVRHWTTTTGAAQLEFVAFLDGDEASGECRVRDERALAESVGRPALTWLQ